MRSEDDVLLTLASTASRWMPVELKEECRHLQPEDIAFLQTIVGHLPILADLSRADLLLYCQPSNDQAVVIAQGQPHSVPPIYGESLVGRGATQPEEPLLRRVFSHGRAERGAAVVRGAPIVQEVYPVVNRQGQVIAALRLETSLVERERHLRRSRVFQRALSLLQQMVLHGELRGAEKLSPFAEHDGIIFVDTQQQIRYVSGVAENLYRKLGYAEKLVGLNLAILHTHEEVYFQALESLACVEEETQEGELIWIRKAIPILDRQPAWWQRWLPPAAPGQPRLYGILIAIHDATEARRKERDLRVKSALIQEIHHRVKNNLQTIASLLRLQARRASTRETRLALEEALGRISSVAVVHEFLSHDEASDINIREVSQRIVNLTQEGILDPAKGIQLVLQGAGFSLPPQQATACALVLNELVQNAVEHGYTDRRGGTITINLQASEQECEIDILDDGEGLPPAFDLEQSHSLGLRIVQTLVEDLNGHFELLSNGRGTRAMVRFPRKQSIEHRA